MPCPSSQENTCSLFRHELHPHQEMSPQDRASAKTSPRPMDSTYGIKHQLLNQCTKWVKKKKWNPKLYKQQESQP